LTSPIRKCANSKRRSEKPKKKKGGTKTSWKKERKEVKGENKSWTPEGGNRQGGEKTHRKVTKTLKKGITEEGERFGAVERIIRKRACRGGAKTGLSISGDLEKGGEK